MLFIIFEIWIAFRLLRIGRTHAKKKRTFTAIYSLVASSQSLLLAESTRVQSMQFEVHSCELRCQGWQSAAIAILQFTVQTNQSMNHAILNSNINKCCRKRAPLLILPQFAFGGKDDIMPPATQLITLAWQSLVRVRDWTSGYLDGVYISCVDTAVTAAHSGVIGKVDGSNISATKLQMVFAGCELQLHLCGQAIDWD